MTVEALVRHVTGVTWEQPPDKHFLCWPPDAFAVTGTILKASGAYVNVVARSWPPAFVGTPLADVKPHSAIERTFTDRYHQIVSTIGLTWRRSWVLTDEGYGDNTIPDEVLYLWSKVWEFRGTALREVRHKDALWQPLVLILAIADEASGAVGLKVALDEPFLIQGAMDVLRSLNGTESTDPTLPPSLQATNLCKKIGASKTHVLPKMCTPQSGMTIRSLSHHLALICDTEAVPRWYNTYSSNSQRFRESLNLLLLPWPMKVNPGQFRSVDEEVIKKTNISEKEFGLFQFVPSEPNRMEIAKVEKLCRQVTDEIGALHGIVLPDRQRIS